MILKRTIGLLSIIILLFNLISCKEKQVLRSYNMSLRGFVEEKIELSNIEYIEDIKMIDDDTIKLIGADNNLKEIVLISEDKGKTWIEREVESTDLKEDRMLFLSVFNNGDILAIDGSENTNKFILIKDNGLIGDIDIDNNNFMAVNVSQNNDILVYDVYNIYLYNLKDGKLKKEIKLDDEIISVCTTDKYLIVQTVQAIKKYNLNNGEFIEDIEELQEYIDRDITYKLKIFNSREDDEILLIDSIGIYSVNSKDYNTNQMIDANAYLFNSIEKELAHFLQLDNDNFLAVYYGEDGMEMYTYSYSDKLANKELEEITIYSLYESESILQYTSQYQNDNPNIVINYEVGITKDSGQTENDAIKTLNTELMSDNAPDILFLDNLSSENLINKGVLEDISDIVNSKKESLFENILDIYFTGDKIYSLPLRVKIPVIFGVEDIINKFSNLENILDNKDEINNRLFGTYSARDILNLMYNINNDKLIENNIININEIKLFLENIKEIYEFEKSNIDEDSYNNYLEYAEQMSNEFMRQMSEVYLEKNIDPIEVLRPEYSMDIGYISSFYDLANIYTVMQEDKNLKYTTYSGSNKFLGKDIISITSKSNKKEIAKDFISYVIDKKSQEINNYKGIPINKETLLSIYKKNVGNDNLGEIGISGEEYEIDLDIKWPSEDEYNKFVNIVSNLSSSINVNSYISEVVINVGEEYLMDEISLDEALDKINIDLEIYLME
ncbi:ABC transporter substrate-binding protein [Clostridium sp. D53t1_180928_C8]|uniref:ABC transporter substrate-binding protein n=1 Tax=Clostridium sp. D53t1_180928_C8 TaxID=2787101 RepID=UPI0018AC08D1|nr:ABC transporter substrate-binding protein [Clostridium sp. D53t1_180928_C8]